MNYVELLRATRNLMICGLALTGVLVIVLAIWFGFHITSDHHVAVPLTLVWAIAGIVASGFASSLAGSLAAENDGHLPVAWTKPFARASYAIATIATDLGAILLVFLMTCATIFIFFAATGTLGGVKIESDTWGQLVRFLIAPAAFFGLIQLLTATLARQAGAVIWCTWVACFVLLTLELTPLPKPFGAIVSTIGFANPLIYITFDVDKNGTIILYQLAGSLMGLALIAIIGNSTAIYRWQRSEA